MSKSTDLSVEILGPADELPLSLRTKTKLSAVLGRVLIAMSVLVFALLIWSGYFPFGGPTPALVVALVGVFILIRGLSRVQRTQEFRIDAATVEKVGGPGGNWSAPISSYRGVRWRRQNLDFRGNMQNVRQLNQIDLVHDDPSRTVPLFARITGQAGPLDTFSLVRQAFRASNQAVGPEDEMQAEAMQLARKASGADVRDVWQDFAQLLNLPAIDARGDAEEPRDAADLDKSIATLAAEGKIDDTWDDRPAPPSLLLEKVDGAAGGEALKVKILDSRLPKFMPPLFIAMGILMLGFGVFDGQIGLVLTGGLFAVIPYGVAKLQAKNPRTLTITRKDLRHENPMIGTKEYDFTLPLNTIKSLHIAQRSDTEATGFANRFVGNELAITTDDLEYRVGRGLDDAALDWLEAYMRAAISTA